MDPRIESLVKNLAEAKSFVDAPTFLEVANYLKTCFPGAEKFAGAFYRAMSLRRWKGKDGRPINDWRRMAKAYASAAYRNQ